VKTARELQGFNFFLGHDIMTDELTLNIMLRCSYNLLAVLTCQIQSI